LRPSRMLGDHLGQLLETQTPVRKAARYANAGPAGIFRPHHCRVTLGLDLVEMEPDLPRPLLPAPPLGGVELLNTKSRCKNCSQPRRPYTLPAICAGLVESSDQPGLAPRTQAFVTSWDRMQPSTLGGRRIAQVFAIDSTRLVFLSPNSVAECPAQMIGHSTPGILQKYSRAVDEYRRDAVRKLENMRKGQAQEPPPSATID